MIELHHCSLYQNQHNSIINVSAFPTKDYWVFLTVTEEFVGLFNKWQLVNLAHFYFSVLAARCEMWILKSARSFSIYRSYSIFQFSRVQKAHRRSDNHLNHPCKTFNNHHSHYIWQLILKVVKGNYSCVCHSPQFRSWSWNLCIRTLTTQGVEAWLLPSQQSI